MLRADATQLRELAPWSTPWCVSLFVPAHDVVGKRSGDSLVWKNLIRTAEDELLTLGVRRAEAEEMLTEVIPGEVHDPASETFHRAGFAVFVAPGFRRTYHLTRVAPELVTVARRFHLKPLLGELERQRRFFVLAVTRGHAALHVGGAERLRALDVPGMPTSLEDAVQYDDRERVLLSHSAARRGVGGVVAAFHGQGDRGDHLSEDVLRYLRMVDDSLNGIVAPTDPLVLVGSRDIVAAFRTQSSHGELYPQAIHGNPAQMAPDALHARVTEIVEGATSSPDADAARFAELHGTGMASDDLVTASIAAQQGRVATIFVASDVQRWGRVATDAAELHETRGAGDTDLLDVAAVDAWRSGATVHVIPQASIPGDGEVAALFRY